MKAVRSSPFNLLLEGGQNLCLFCNYSRQPRRVERTLSGQRHSISNAFEMQRLLAKVSHLTRSIRLFGHGSMTRTVQLVKIELISEGQIQYVGMG